MTARYEVRNYNAGRHGIWDTRRETWWAGEEDGYALTTIRRYNAQLIAAALSDEDRNPLAELIASWRATAAEMEDMGERSAPRDHAAELEDWTPPQPPGATAMTDDDYGIWMRTETNPAPWRTRFRRNRKTTMHEPRFTVRTWSNTSTIEYGVYDNQAREWVLLPPGDVVATTDFYTAHRYTETLNAPRQLIRYYNGEEREL